MRHLYLALPTLFAIAVFYCWSRLSDDPTNHSARVTWTLVYIGQTGVFGLICLILFVEVGHRRINKRKALLWCTLFGVLPLLAGLISPLF